MTTRARLFGWFGWAFAACGRDNATVKDTSLASDTTASADTSVPSDTGADADRDSRVTPDSTDEGDTADTADTRDTTDSADTNGVETADSDDVAGDDTRLPGGIYYDYPASWAAQPSLDLTVIGPEVITTSAATVDIDGLVGRDAAVTWQVGAFSGTAAGTSDWVARAIPLALGDNVITFSAQAADEHQDVVVHAFRNAALGVGAARVWPTFAAVGEATRIEVAVPIEDSPLVDRARLTLVLVAPDGGEEAVATLGDDGVDDAAAQDGIYSASFEVTRSAAVNLRLEARAALVTGGAERATLATIQVVVPPQPSDFAAIAASGRAVLEAFTARLPDEGPEAAFAAALAVAEADPTLAHVYAEPPAITLVQPSGLHAVVNVSPQDTRAAGPELVTNPAGLALDAVWPEFGANTVRSFFATTLRDKATCPGWPARVIEEGPALAPDGFRKAERFGYLIIDSHGTVAQLANKKRYTLTLARYKPDDLVYFAVRLQFPVAGFTTNPPHFLATTVNDPAIHKPYDLLLINSVWFKDALPTLGGTVVFANTCKSQQQNDLAAAFLSHNASAFIGWSDSVGVALANSQARAFTACMFEGATGKLRAQTTPADCFKDKVTGPPPPRISVGGKAVTFTGATDVINGDFEAGELAPWRAKGQVGPNVAVLRNVGGGAFAPSQGDWMGYLTTGIGRIPDRSGFSSIGQTVCLQGVNGGLPARSLFIGFDYRVLSREPKTFCETHEDALVIAVTAGVKVATYRKTVKDLCAANAFAPSPFTPADAIVPSGTRSTCDDPDGWWVTPWRTDKVDISALVPTVDALLASDIKIEVRSDVDNVCHSGVMIDKVGLTGP